MFNKDEEELYKKLILKGDSLSALNIFIKSIGSNKSNKELVKRNKIND